MSTSEQISPLSVILEPSIVASLLTVSVLLNRRTSSELRAVSTSILGSQSSTPRNRYLPVLFYWVLPVPDNSQFRSRLISRFLARFPFLLEVWYWLLTYWVYQIGRAISALTLVSETTALARDHGSWLLEVESKLHINVELALQHWMLRSDSLTAFLNKTYSYVHIPATIVFVGYYYHICKGPRSAVFRRTRRTLVFCNLMAFVIFTSWPCMPPRLLPDEYGFIDTVHKNRVASAWTTNRFQNQLAAMPSLHFGYSLLIGVSLSSFSLSPSPNPFVRRLSLAYPALILVTIMATANHYLLDAMAGGIIAFSAWKAEGYRAPRAAGWEDDSGLLIRAGLRYVEEWGFWLCGVEKPMDREIFEMALGGYDVVSPHSEVPPIGSPMRDIASA